MKKKLKPPTTPATNPFAGKKKDIYLTTNKIAVTTTTSTAGILQRLKQSTMRRTQATCASLKPRKAILCVLAERARNARKYRYVGYYSLRSMLY